MSDPVPACITLLTRSGNASTDRSAILQMGSKTVHRLIRFSAGNLLSAELRQTGFRETLMPSEFFRREVLNLSDNVDAEKLFW
jgi:hypothetical protein